MGATTFIATHGSDEAFGPYARTLDLIICTSNDVNMPLAGYLSLLRPGGRLISTFERLSLSQEFSI